MPDDFSPEEFARHFQKFLQFVNANAPDDTPSEPLILDRLKAFLQVEPSALVVAKEEFLERDLPNLQRAFDYYLTGPERFAEQVGYTTEYEGPGFGLANILSQRRYYAATVGPVGYRSVALANGERLQCMERGLYFITDHGRPAVVMVRHGEHFGQPPLSVEILCQDAERAEAMLAELRRLIHAHNVYRGQIISLGAGGADDVRFHALPAVQREDIILPAGLLEAVERNTLGFAAQAERLRQSGRHTRRGLLFHGPPGTGKTLTIMYLAKQMAGRTVILLTGRVLGLITQSCQMARLLAPALVVLEDVDLVAQERDSDHERLPLLFELLNEMDGLAEDTDVMFFLSTNRPDLLEPALAARPGRIDQALEFPLPDADARRRLFELYGRGLNLQAPELDDMVRRTEGASPAFIRELLRKAALVAADETLGAEGPVTVTDAHLRDALRAILGEGGRLTQTLLGVTPGTMDDPA